MKELHGHIQKKLISLVQGKPFSLKCKSAGAPLQLSGQATTCHIAGEQWPWFESNPQPSCISSSLSINVKKIIKSACKMTNMTLILLFKQ